MAKDELKENILKYVGKIDAKDEDLRNKAIEVLVAAGEPSAPVILGYMAWACKIKNEKRLDTMVDILTRIGEPAVPYLVKECKSWYEGVRLHSAIALMRIGGETAEAAALPCLVKLIGSSDQKTKEKAFVSIRDGDSQMAKDVLSELTENFAGGDSRIADMVRETIVADESHISVIIQAIKDCTQTMRYQHADMREPMLELGEKLKKIGKPVIPELGKVIQDDEEDEYMRCVAISILAEMGDMDATPVLEKMVDSQASEVAMMSVLSLTKFGDSFIPIVVKAVLFNRSYKVRDYAQKCLIEAVGKAAVPALAEELASVSEKDHKKELIRILRKIGDPAAAPALNEMLNDEDKGVRKEAEKALKKCRG